MILWYRRPMARGYWTSLPDTIDLEGEQLVFDTHGTPMDMEWSLSTTELCDPIRGRVGRSFIETGFGVEVLREILARIGGPPPESFPPEPPPPPALKPPRRRRAPKPGATIQAPPIAPPPPPAPIPPAIEGPVHLAIALFSDVIIAAGLPMPQMAAPVMESESVALDGAEGQVARWRMFGTTGPTGVEAGVEGETAWWNPHTPARSSVTAKILDHRAGLRAIFVSAEAPFDAWELRTIGQDLIPRAWLEAWLAKRERRLV